MTLALTPVTGIFPRCSHMFPWLCLPRPHRTLSIRLAGMERNYSQCTSEQSKLQTKPFSTDVVKQYLSAYSYHSSANLEDAISLCSNIPRLLHLLCTTYDPMSAVKREIESEYIQVFLSMSDFNDLVDWESELKLMLTAA